MGLSNPLHIAFVLVLLLLVFGAKRLPEMGRSLGAGMRGFKDTLSGEGEHHDSTTAEATVLAPVAATTPAAVPAQASVAMPVAAAAPITPAPVPVATAAPAPVATPAPVRTITAGAGQPGAPAA